ncbi:hypothetical protein [Rhodococcus sovatensis]|uniref:Uncharacterized protein n=1 Tax=Rhodococcus sovatensis TaxID=1805840 RepID=A0ABZ2PQN5_9NOCA
MSSTPIHDELQNILGIETRGVDRTVEPFTETAPEAAPRHPRPRHQRA